MIFNWIDYLTLAHKLNTKSANEAELRTCVSRAYYSALHRARILCLDDLRIIKSSDFFGASSHKIVIDALMNQDDIELYQIGHRLSVLKERREIADYKSRETVEYAFANDSFLKATDIISLIKNYTA